MKKEYQIPEMNVYRLHSEDIVTESNTTVGFDKDGKVVHGVGVSHNYQKE